MLGTLQTLSDAAYGIGSIPLPATSNSNEDSIASTPNQTPKASLLFLKVEEEEPVFHLLHIDELLPVKSLIGDTPEDAQSENTPDLKLKLEEITLDITTALDGWGSTDKRWGPLPQPNGWETPSSKPYSVDDYPILSPPMSQEDWDNFDADTEASLYEEGELPEGVSIGHSDDTWPSPPPEPYEGNDMRPPHRSFSGADPGADWRYNQFGDLDYYRFLIADPNFPG